MAHQCTRCALAFVLAVAATPALSREIATCGNSNGYAYYPKVGLAAQNKDAGKWITDGVTGGKFTLSETSKNEFDLLIADASGKIFSAKQDGGVVMLTGASSNSMSVLVSYPKTSVTETYTFFRLPDGKAEAIWTSNKGGSAVISKVSAMRATCSYFAF